ncbi:LLM class flavin-dependent oxidoreductase [Nocardia sp. CA-120079]|uniref:LLM class flavin-dependent oxidoreductase n=1 Tax=Nocardia sp. CA-120079 TaxID=3239974 RepID=UPI003D987266
MAAMQRQVLAQYEQGVLADRLGFDYYFLTEHHFQPEGAEFSPNPLMLQAALAVNTRRIRLGQMANILPWHHPVRIAEQAATLDILSGGRLEFGIGRGYQAREAEVLGRPYGAGIQDQEANRAMFEEAYEIVLKCFTEKSLSHRGEFFSIPPSYLTWHHAQTIAYFSQEGVGRTVDQVLNLGVETGGPGVQSGSTTLREITVAPQPLQKPYPQMWMPMTSKRSAQWAAAHGVNGIYAAAPTRSLQKEIDTYFDAAEKAGWVDRFGDGKPLKRGWDAERKRGVAAVRMVHTVHGELGNAERYHQGANLYFNYMQPFGFLGAILTGIDDAAVPSGEDLADAGLQLVGSPDLILDSIDRMKTAGGFEDLFIVLNFDAHSLSNQEVMDQMQFFAEDIMPVLHKEYGRKPQDEPALTPPPLSI